MNKEITDIEEKLRSKGRGKLDRELDSIYSYMVQHLQTQFSSAYITRYVVDAFIGTRETVRKQLGGKYEQRSIDNFLNTVDLDIPEDDDLVFPQVEPEPLLKP